MRDGVLSVDRAGRVPRLAPRDRFGHRAVVDHDHFLIAPAPDVIHDLTLHRRAMFIRVKDNGTGHEFDVPEDSVLLRRGVVTHVKPVRYPPSHVMRPPKYNVSLAGRPATQEQSAPTGDDQATPTEE